MSVLYDAGALIAVAVRTGAEVLSTDTADLNRLAAKAGAEVIVRSV